MKRKLALFISFGLFMIFGCRKEGIPITPQTVKDKEKNPPLDQPDSIVYKTAPAPGKLPFPFHNPEWSEQELNRAVNQLFIVNNYGEYQIGEERSSAYFHDGLDIVLPNGTPIFAISKGIVRAIIGNAPYYKSLVVEDLDHPGMAWSYTHVYNFNVHVGEVVSQGKFLARVNFKGIDHIHLSRSRLRKGGNWNFYEDIINTYPDDFFDLKDNIPPIIKKPFHYFKNNSDDMFSSSTGIPTVNGEVDIVVSMRDVTNYSRGSIHNSVRIGDRFAVKHIEYSILRDGKIIGSFKSFDFSKIDFNYAENKWKQVFTVYKLRTLLEDEPLPYDKYFTHYIITNAREDLSGIIDPSDGQLAWDTQAQDQNGQPLYPNGVYTIRVTAYDTNENATTVEDQVQVRNN